MWYFLLRAWYDIGIVYQYMERENKNKEIKDIADQIAKEYKPEKIILFGSYAWGEPTKDSDIDLLVVKDSDKNSLEMNREVSRIIFGRGMAMDILVYTSKQLEKRRRMGDPFLMNILNSGQILYAK